jgi:hypothetical protein
VTGVKWRNPETRLSEAFRATAASVRGHTVTLRELLELVGEQGILVLGALLSIPFVIPVPVPMISVILGTPLLLIGVAVTLNSVPWLPARLLDHALSGDAVQHAFATMVRLAERFEHLVKPRLLGMTGSVTVNRMNGVMIVLATVVLIAPLPLVPFTNTFPGLALLFLCLGMAERDGVLVLLGYLMTVLGGLYVSGIFFALFHAGSWLGRLLAPVVQFFGGTGGA